MIERDFIRRMYAKYGGPGGVSCPAAGETASASLIDRFLEDASIPLAVLHSHALGRDFVLARDAAALESLSEESRLPVLTFADCEKLGGLAAGELAVILDVRSTFGPAAELVAVRSRLG